MNQTQALENNNSANAPSITNYLCAFLFGFIVSYISGFFAVFLGLFAYLIIGLFYFLLPHYFRNFPEPLLPYKLLYILGALVRLMFLVIYLSFLSYAPIGFLNGNAVVALGLLSGPENCCQIEKAIDERVKEQRQTTDRDLFNDNQPLKRNSDGILYSVGTDLEDINGELNFDITNGVISPGDIFVLSNQPE